MSQAQQIQTPVRKPQKHCRVMTGPWPDQPKQRCTRKVDHRGPHWDKTEDVPDGCTCTPPICFCGLQEVSRG